MGLKKCQIKQCPEPSAQRVLYPLGDASLESSSKIRCLHQKTVASPEPFDETNNFRSHGVHDGQEHRPRAFLKLDNTDKLPRRTRRLSRRPHELMPDQSAIAPSMYDDAVDRRPAKRVRIAVSSCLLGNHVRYDGGHQRDEFVVDVLALVCELVPVCPEVAIGLGVPRPPIRLLGDLTRPRARGVESNELDVTAALTQYAAHMAREINEISGYVFKSKSPSCGIRGVKVHVPGARPASTGGGVFAREFTALQPLLPVEDEARLARPGLRDCFIERVLAYRRWQDLVASGITRPRLARFHAMHKLTFMAHGSTQHPHLELAVDSRGRALPALIRAYQRDFMRMLQQRTTRRHHVRVLNHVMRHLVTQLQSGDRVELRAAINAYALGRSPRFLPITLLRHQLRHFPNPDLVDQIYLNPRPEELMLYHPRW